MDSIEDDFTCIDRTGRAPIFLIDQDISLKLGYARRSVAWINTSIAHDRDAAIFKRLLKTRKNNKRARAYAEQPGELGGEVA